jgi:hypothetical protein
MAGLFVRILPSHGAGVVRTGFKDCAAVPIARVSSPPGFLLVCRAAASERPGSITFADSAVAQNQLPATFSKVRSARIERHLFAHLRRTCGADVRIAIAG